MVKKKIAQINFSRIGENISALMGACGIDATELSMQTGLPTSTISRLRSNNMESSPNLSSLLPVANFFRITLSQLIGEEPIDQTVYGTFKPQNIKKLPIPVLCAETISYSFPHKPPQHLPIEIPRIDVDIHVSQNSFAYFVQSNAMEPQFPDKTLLIIDPEIIIENLDHILVIPPGKKTPIFRQVMIDGDEKYLRALNPAFNEFIKFDIETYQVLGVMVQSRRTFKNSDLSFLFHTIATTKISES